MPVRFIIPNLKNDQIANLRKQFVLLNGGNPLDPLQDPLADRDPNLAINGQVLNISYTYKDLLSKFGGGIGQAMGDFIKRQGEETIEQCFIRLYGQPGVAGEAERFGKDARDHYRGFNFQPTPAPNLAGAGTPNAALGTALNGTQGASFGRKHGDGASLDVLIDAITNGDIPPNGGALLAIEEFNVTLQQDLDDYMALPAGSPLPAGLQKRLKALEDGQQKMQAVIGQQFGDRFQRLVQAAQVAQVPLVAIDSGLASPSDTPNTDPAFFERRAVQMNLVAENAINDAKQRYNLPNAQIVAACGAAHSTTHPGGVPGLAQIFDLPSVKLDPAGQLVLDPEDQTNRTMPSPVEQEFVAAFLSEAKKSHKTYDKKNPNECFDYKSLVTGAQRLAAKLLAAGKLPDLGANAVAMDPNQAKQAVTAAMNLSETKAAIDGEVMKASQTKRTAELKWPATPPSDKILKVLNETPELAAMAFPGKDAAAAEAVVKGQFGAVGNLLAGGADPTTTGITLQDFAFAVAKTRNDGQKGEQAAVLDTLLGNMNVQVDAQDGQGRTLAHLAAWNGNELALDTIALKAGDLTLTDNRGWTPRTVAMASDKPAAEQYFTTNNIEAPTALLPQGNATFDTVQMLADATMCENANHNDKMKAMYKELYANPTLRPILNLIAVDAARPRDPANGKGLRLVAANHSNVSNLFHPAKEDSTLQGAYADENHVMMVSCMDVGDSSGTLIHELTHAAARLMYGQDTIPAQTGSQKMADYKNAISADMRNLHLMNPKDDFEVRVKERIADRMADYAKKAPGQGKHPDVKLLQEFLVSVPQMISDFGEETVQRFAPNLLAYFKDFGQQIDNALQTDVRFSGVAAQLDNTVLDANVGPRTKKVVTGDRRTKGSETFTLDEVKKKLAAEVALRKGKFKSSMANGATIPYSSDNFVMKDPQEQDPVEKLRLETEQIKLDNATRVLESVWPKASDGAAPPTLSFEETKDLISRLADNVDKPVKEQKEAMQNSIGTWSRNAKVAYVDHQIKHGKRPTENELAEAIVSKAENRIFEAYPVTTGEEAPEVDASKRTKLVTDLTGQLTTLFLTKNPDLEELVTKLSDGVAGGKALGMYKKEKEQDKGSAHVSINVKNTKNTWVQKLGTF